MPDGTTSLKPPASRWSERLARLQIMRRKVRAEDRQRRRFSEARLETAQLLLGQILDGADHIADIAIAHPAGARCKGVCLLVTLDDYDFKQLCVFGAELEDLEDSHDREPTEADHGEVALGWGDDQSALYLCADEAEPSLGAVADADQTRWGSVGDRTDLERADEDDEPSLQSTFRMSSVVTFPLSAIDLEDDGIGGGHGGAKGREIIANARTRLRVSGGVR